MQWNIGEAAGALAAQALNLNSSPRHPRHAGAAGRLPTSDLDGLKRLNDARGHARGDHFLEVFAAALAGAFTSVGPAYRIGGDEFAVLSQQAHGSGVLDGLLAQTQAQMREQGFPDGTVSMGSAAYPHEARAADTLLSLSDHRMYSAKVAQRLRLH